MCRIYIKVNIEKILYSISTTNIIQRCTECDRYHKQQQQNRSNIVIIQRWHVCMPENSETKQRKPLGLIEEEQSLSGIQHVNKQQLFYIQSDVSMNIDILDTVQMGVYLKRHQLDLGMQLSDRVFDYHTQGPGLDPQSEQTHTHTHISSHKYHHHHHTHSHTEKYNKRKKRMWKDPGHYECCHSLGRGSRLYKMQALPVMKPHSSVAFASVPPPLVDLRLVYGSLHDSL